MIDGLQEIQTFWFQMFSGILKILEFGDSEDTLFMALF